MNNVLFSLGANIVSKMIILLINILSFRVLLPEDYGVISLLLAMTATIGAVASMGASVAVNSIVAREGFSSLTALFIRHNYIMSFLVSVVMAGFIYIFYSESISQIPPGQCFVFIFIFSLLSSLNSISEAILIGLHDFKKFFLNNFTSFLVFLPLSFYLVTTFKVGGVLLSLLLYRAFLLFVNFYSVSQTKILKINYYSIEEKRKVYKIFKEISFPSILSGLLVAPIIGGAFKIVTLQEQGLQKIAYFNIVYQIYLVAIFIPNALNGYLISRFSSQQGNAKRDFLKISKNNFFFALVVSSSLLVFQKVFFIIVDDQSATLVNNYYIMLGAIVLYSLNAVYSSFWPSIGRAWFGFLMNVIWAVLLLSVTFIFSEYGVSEALAWAFFIAYLFLGIIQTLSYKVVSYEKK